MAEIADPKNDYNLNMPRYIDATEPEDLQDLHAHLHGGIPDRDLDALRDYWEPFPQLRGQLFTAQPPRLQRPRHRPDRRPASHARRAWLQQAARRRVDDRVRLVRDPPTQLATIDADTNPANLIAAMSEDLLGRFDSVPLLDKYDAYQQLMTYWHDVMHDDVFLLMNDGWINAAKPRKTIEDKERKLSEDPDLVLGTGRKATKYKMDLIPPALIVARYFADEQARVDELNLAQEEASRAVEEFVEEHSVEDGLLAEAMDDDKINKGLASKRLRDIRRDGDLDEVEALQHLVKLYDTEAAHKKAAKEAQAELDEQTLRQYGDLTEADVQSLVLESGKPGSRAASTPRSTH